MDKEAIKLKLKQVKEQGLNIYSLMNRFRKERGWPKEMLIPDEVLDKICDQYLKRQEKLKNAWPWFIQALKAESAQWFAKQNIAEHQRSKREKSVLSMGDIMKGMK